MKTIQGVIASVMLLAVEGKYMERDQIANELVALSNIADKMESEDTDQIFYQLHQRKNEIQKLMKKHPQFAHRYQAELVSIKEMINPVDEEDFYMA